MSEKCTIYCNILDLDRVSELLQSQFPTSNDIRFKSNSVTVNGNSGNIMLTAKIFHESGDEFCKLILATQTFVKKSLNGPTDVKNRLASHIMSSKLVLGVVAEPTFDSDERYEKVVFIISDILNGIVFNGNVVLGANGDVLLSS